MSDLHDKEAFFKKAREMAEGLSKEQLIGYYMAELETCCECEEKLKASEKTNTKIMDYAVDLEKQLAESEEEKETLICDYESRITKEQELMSWLEHNNEQLKQQLAEKEKDKISFAVEKLEKVKEKFGYKHNSQLVISSKQLVDFIDNEINELKGKVEDVKQ